MKYKTSDFEFYFKDENLQKKFVKTLNDTLVMFNNLKLTDRKIYFNTANAVVRGKMRDILYQNLKNYEDTQLNFENWVGGESKNASFNKKFEKTNSFTTFHESEIYRNIEKKNDGTLRKLVRDLQKLNTQLERYEYEYNLVYYLYYRG